MPSPAAVEQHLDVAFSAYSREHGKSRAAYLGMFLAQLGNEYDAEANPDGKVTLCVAENKLMEDALRARLRETFACLAEDRADQPDFPVPRFSLHYHDFAGTNQIKRAFADVLGRHVFTAKQIDGGSTGSGPVPIQIDPSKLCITNGCTSLIVSLARILCDRDEAIMYFVPRYAGFATDIGGYAQAKMVGVPLEFDHRDGNVITCHFPSDETLDDYFVKGCCQNQKDGAIKSIKALLVASPDNPTGTVWREEELLRLRAWCRRKKILLLSDEIYAAGVFPAGAATPAKLSAQPVDDAGRDDQRASQFFSLYEHADVTFWGLSKDFASSGSRLAVAYIPNEKLLQAFQEVNMVNSVGCVTEQVATHMLSDASWIAKHLEASREAVVQHYGLLAECLEKLKIPFVRPNAALFLWADFSEFGTDLAGSQPLFEELLNDYALMLTPGVACYDDPSLIPRAADAASKDRCWMRMCYAAVRTEALRHGLTQLEKFANDRRLQGENGKANARTH